MKRGLLLLLTATILLMVPKISFGQIPNLGAASSFAVFTAVGAFTSDGATTITGDVGTNAGAFTGFPPGTFTGQSHVADSSSVLAATDVQTAYSALTGITCDTTIGTTLGNSQILTPKVYCLGAASTLNGTLTLDGQANPNSVFIIKINGPLSATAGSTINLINGATTNNVFFQINGAVDVATNSVFKGNILANGAISFFEGASLQGRALSREGAISLHNNRIRLMPVFFCGCVH